MKLTDHHISNEKLNLLIAVSEYNGSDPDILSILLELKQRRIEDKQREYDKSEG